MKDIQIFENERLGKIRVIEKDGEPWFVTRDVCAVLGIDVNSGARGLNDNEKGLHNMQTLGGSQQVAIIRESGLYKLAFKSRKQKAEEFTDWVTSEVLPAIRKTGAYMTPAQRKAELLALMKDQEGKISKNAMGKLALMAAHLITGIPIPGASWSTTTEAVKAERDNLKNMVARYMETVYPSERRPVRVTCEALYTGFKSWCSANNCKPCSRGRFYCQLTALGFSNCRKVYRDREAGTVTRGYDLE